MESARSKIGRYRGAEGRSYRRTIDPDDSTSGAIGEIRDELLHTLTSIFVHRKSAGTAADEKGYTTGYLLCMLEPVETIREAMR